MPSSSPLLQPRKTPVQARSIATVETILEATIQVLVSDGMKKLNTTKVAERAGVSVGSVYQYFPNKQSLLAGVLEAHLLNVVEAVEHTCSDRHGDQLDGMATALVGAYIDTKLKRPDASKALYAVAGEMQGTELVGKIRGRVHAAVKHMLLSACGRIVRDPDTASLVLMGAIVGPVQTLLVSGTEPRLAQAVREHLILLACGYLMAISLPLC